MSRADVPVGQRQLRVAEEVRHALAWILERGEMRDPVLANTPITVTEVRISSDLRHATVFVMPLGGKEETAVVGALGRASGYLRRQIAHAVHLKFVPDMTFRIDRSFEQADRITRILNEPAVSRDLDQTRRRDADDFGEE